MVIPATSSDTKEFRAYCINLAKEIDAAVGKNEVPGNVQELTLILNHVCGRRCDDQTRAVVMALMISAKSACQLGWFPQRETQELLAIVDLMRNGFSTSGSVTPSVNSSVSLLTQVMERFYPFVKLGHILLSFEAKPESKILIKDFHISTNMPFSPKQKIGLFVVRTENISKSNCIVHPQEVSFLLNGKGVHKRVNISMDSGPQLPTNVSALLNPGANLLQAIGCFGGSYFIAIAFMDVLPLPDKPLLKDYVHSEVIDSDCDVVEGSSRISLSCPISRTRIKLPVKGNVCKHLQCFDYWNYINMNMRRPSWRCPHCNQSVCYTDIRVDQKMKMILEEAGRSAANVVISADRSWRVVTENDEAMEVVPETTHDHGSPNNFIDLGLTVLDLVRDENEMETFDGTQVNEPSFCVSEIQGQSNNTHKPATNYTMVNQFSASANTLPQLPQTLNAIDGQQFVNFPQVVNSRDSAARQAFPMTFLPTSSPLDRANNAANFHTSMPAAQSSQLQGSHFPSLGHCLGRTSDLMERWNNIHGRGINRNQLPPVPPFHHQFGEQNQSFNPAQQRPMTASTAQPQNGGNADQRSMPSSGTYLQTLHVNYGRTTDQRPISSSIPHLQILHDNNGGNTYQMPMPSSIAHIEASLSNYRGIADQRLVPTSVTNLRTLPVSYGGTVDQRPMPSSVTHIQTLPVNYGGANGQSLNPGGAMGQYASRELIDLTPANTANRRAQSRMRGSLEPGTGYDHMIIRPTEPVQAQAQTLPRPQSTAYNNLSEEIQAFLGHPSNRISNNETQARTSSLTVAEDTGFTGSFWSMPPETW